MKWENGFNKNCLINLLQLLIDHYQQELVTVDQDIQALLLTGAHLYNTTEFTLREAELNNHLEKLNRKIVTTKEKKLLRDHKAFATKKASRWFDPLFVKGADLFSAKLQMTYNIGVMRSMILTFLTPLHFLLCPLTTLINAGTLKKPVDGHPQDVGSRFQDSNKRLDPPHARGKQPPLVSGNFSLHIPGPFFLSSTITSSCTDLPPTISSPKKTFFSATYIVSSSHQNSQEVFTRAQYKLFI